jgi:hypothetical protein
MTPLYASDGGRADRSRLDLKRGIAVSDAPVAAVSGRMSEA